MNKHILAAVIRDDKTKTLFLIEPFYFTCSHVFLLLTHTAGSSLFTEGALARIVKKRPLHSDKIA